MRFIPFVNKEGEGFSLVRSKVMLGGLEFWQVTKRDYTVTCPVTGYSLRRTAAEDLPDFKEKMEDARQQFAASVDADEVVRITGSFTTYYGTGQHLKPFPKDFKVIMRSGKEHPLHMHNLRRTDRYIKALHDSFPNAFLEIRYYCLGDKT